MEKNVQVFEMGLCEVEHVYLKPGKLYRFIVIPGCKKCKALANVYRDEKEESDTRERREK